MFFENKLHLWYFGQLYLIFMNFPNDFIDFGNDLIAPPQGTVVRLIE